MKFNEFEHDFFPHILLPLLGGLFVLAALQTAARSEPSQASAPGFSSGADSFVVSAADGYGVNECIKSGDDCAKIVADAWCESHGHGDAKAFGPASDATGSIDTVSAKPEPARVIRDDDVFISCGE